MGGSAFAAGKNPLFTPRMPKDVYEAIKARCHSLLREDYLCVASPIDGPGKNYFGDVDILLAWPKHSQSPASKHEILKTIAQTLQATQMIFDKGPNVAAHFAIPWPCEEAIVLDGYCDTHTEAEHQLEQSLGSHHQNIDGRHILSNYRTIEEWEAYDNQLLQSSQSPATMRLRKRLGLRNFLTWVPVPLTAIHRQPEHETLQKPSQATRSLPLNTQSEFSPTSFSPRESEFQTTAADRVVSGFEREDDRRTQHQNTFQGHTQLSNDSNCSVDQTGPCAKLQKGHDTADTHETLLTVTCFSNSQEPAILKSKSQLLDVVGVAAQHRPLDQSAPENPHSSSKQRQQQVSNSAQQRKQRFVQVDIRVCDSLEQLHWMLFKHAHGDIWNLLGTTIRPYGLTIDETSLWLRVPEIEPHNRHRAKVFLSSDPIDILKFLGMPIDGYWEEPFDSLEDMFEYTARCRLFWIKPLDLDQQGIATDLQQDRNKLKANDRKRMNQRPGFRKWIEEFKPKCREEGRFLIKPTTREEVTTEAFAWFHVEKEFNSRRREFLLERQKDMIWNIVIKGAVPEVGLSNPDPRDILYRSCLVRALKRVIFEGDDRYGILPETTLKDEEGFYITEDVLDFIARKGDEIGLAAMRINNAAYVHHLEQRAQRKADSTSDPVQEHSVSEGNGGKKKQAYAAYSRGSWQAAFHDTPRSVVDVGIPELLVDTIIRMVLGKESTKDGSHTPLTYVKILVLKNSALDTPSIIGQATMTRRLSFQPLVDAYRRVRYDRGGVAARRGELGIYQLFEHPAPRSESDTSTEDLVASGALALMDNYTPPPELALATELESPVGATILTLSVPVEVYSFPPAHSSPGYVAAAVDSIVSPPVVGPPIVGPPIVGPSIVSPPIPISNENGVNAEPFVHHWVLSGNILAHSPPGHGTPVAELSIVSPPIAPSNENGVIGGAAAHSTPGQEAGPGQDHQHMILTKTFSRTDFIEGLRTVDATGLKGGSAFADLPPQRRQSGTSFVSSTPSRPDLYRQPSIAPSNENGVYGGRSCSPPGYVAPAFEPSIVSPPSGGVVACVDSHFTDLDADNMSRSTKTSMAVGNSLGKGNDTSAAQSPSGQQAPAPTVSPRMNENVAYGGETHSPPSYGGEQSHTPPSGPGYEASQRDVRPWMLPGSDYYPTDGTRPLDASWLKGYRVFKAATIGGRMFLLPTPLLEQYAFWERFFDSGRNFDEFYQDDIDADIFALLLESAVRGNAFNGTESGLNLPVLLFAFKLAVSFGMDREVNSLSVSIFRYIARRIMHINPWALLDDVTLDRDYFLFRSEEIYRSWLCLHSIHPTSNMIHPHELIVLYAYAVPAQHWDGLVDNFSPRFLDNVRSIAAELRSPSNDFEARWLNFFRRSDHISVRWRAARWFEDHFYVFHAINRSHRTSMSSSFVLEED
ncbi:hypothetical protein G7046_g8642 [Stylonectria norvegica]|nr:hypothetical protein G7046_g8642 [Stylonectria norvegica]